MARKCLIFTLLLLGLLQSEVQAVGYTSAASGNWNNTNTWTPNTSYPTNGDTAIISAYSVSNNLAASILSNCTVYVYGTGELKYDAIGPFQNQLFPVTIGVGGTLWFDGDVSIDADAISKVTVTNNSSIKSTSLSTVKRNRKGFQDGATTGMLTLTGGGSVGVEGNNTTFSGGWDVTNGTLHIGADGALGTGLVTIRNGSKLQSVGAYGAAATTGAIPSKVYIEHGGTFVHASTTWTNRWNFEFEDGGILSGIDGLLNPAITFTILDTNGYGGTVLSASGGETLSCIITGSPNSSVISTGANLIVSGSNVNFRGNWTITNGSTVVQHNFAFGTNGAGTVKVSSGATLQHFWSLATFTRDITLDGGTYWFIDNVIHSGIMTVTADSSIKVGTGSGGSLLGLIQGSGKLTKIDGTGKTVTITNAANSFSGGLQVNAGTISVSNPGAEGRGPITVISNATLTLNKAQDWTLTNNLAGQGTIQVEDGTGSKKLTAQGTVGPGTNTATVSTNSTGILTVSGALAFGKVGSQFAQLNIEVAGSNNVAGTDYDRLAVTKSCTALSNANLNVNIPASLSPSVLGTQTFDIVTCTNNMAVLVFNSVSWSNNWSGTVTYGNGYVRLSDLHIAGSLYDVANGDWTNTATWNTGSIPSAGDNVSITNGHYVQIQGGETIPSLNSFQVGGAANSALRFKNAASFTFTNHISLIGGGTVAAVTEGNTPYTFSGGIDVLGTNLLHVAWGGVFNITEMPVTCHSTNDTLQMASYTDNGNGKVVLGVASPAYTGRWEMLPSSPRSFYLFVNVDGGLGSGSVNLRSAGIGYLRFNANQTAAGPDIYIEGGVPVGAGDNGSLRLENANVAFPNNPLLTLKNANIWLNNSGSRWGSRIYIAAGTSGVGTWNTPIISGNISSTQSDGSSTRFVFDNAYIAGGSVTLSGTNTDFHGVFEVRYINNGVILKSEVAAGATDSVIQVNSGQTLYLAKTSAADWALTNTLTGKGTIQVSTGTNRLTAQGSVINPGTSTNPATLTIGGRLAFTNNGAIYPQLIIDATNGVCDQLLVTVGDSLLASSITNCDLIVNADRDYTNRVILSAMGADFSGSSFKSVTFNGTSNAITYLTNKIVVGSYIPYVYNDSVSGNWSNTNTWSSVPVGGDYPQYQDDTVVMDSHTVTANVQIAALASFQIFTNSAFVMSFGGETQNVAATLAGGTMYNVYGMGVTWNGALTVISNSTIFVNRGNPWHLYGEIICTNNNVTLTYRASYDSPYLYLHGNNTNCALSWDIHDDGGWSTPILYATNNNLGTGNLVTVSLQSALYLNGVNGVPGPKEFKIYGVLGNYDGTPSANFINYSNDPIFRFYNGGVYWRGLVRFYDSWDIPAGYYCALGCHDDSDDTRMYGSITGAGDLWDSQRTSQLLGNNIGFTGTLHYYPSSGSKTLYLANRTSGDLSLETSGSTLYLMTNGAPWSITNEIRGIGTVLMQNTGTLSCAGSLSPGTNTGHAAVLTVNGHLAFAAGGKLNIEIAGTNIIAGTGFDQLNVSAGDITLASSITNCNLILDCHSVDLVTTNRRAIVSASGANFTGYAFNTVTLSNTVGNVTVEYLNGSINLYASSGTTAVARNLKVPQYDNGVRARNTLWP